MHEIKFRAWDNQAMTWLRDFAVYETGSLIVWTEQQRQGTAYETYNQSRYSISQYTDLKDKNGKEMYEGDIIKGGALSVIEWTNAWWRVRALEKDSKYTHDLYGYVQGVRPEVIGNIYENPELNPPVHRPD